MIFDLSSAEMMHYHLYQAKIRNRFPTIQSVIRYLKEKSYAPFALPSGSLEMASKQGYETLFSSLFDYAGLNTVTATEQEILTEFKKEMTKGHKKYHFTINISFYEWFIEKIAELSSIAKSFVDYTEKANLSSDQNIAVFYLKLRNFIGSISVEDTEYTDNFFKRKALRQVYTIVEDDIHNPFKNIDNNTLLSLVYNPEEFYKLFYYHLKKEKIVEPFIRDSFLKEQYDRTFKGALKIRSIVEKPIFITFFYVLHMLFYIFLQLFASVTIDLHHLIVDYINNPETEEIYIPESLNTLMIDELIQKSHQSQKMALENVFGNTTTDIAERFDNAFNRIKKIYIETFQFGPAQMRLQQSVSFFQQYYGRIPHLYQRYGGEAVIVENIPLGDPVTILQTSCLHYIADLSNNLQKISADLLNFGKRISSVVSTTQRIQMVNFYCRRYPLDLGNLGMVEDSIINETLWRIAFTILGKHTVYGYTAEGIVYNKKFPPANHIIASLFLENPNESPQEMPVNSIFKNAESLLFFGKNQEVSKLSNEYKRACFHIISSFNTSDIKNIAQAIKRTSNSEVNKLYKETLQHMPEMPKIPQVTLSSNGSAKIKYKASGFQSAQDPKTLKEFSRGLEKGIMKSIDIIIDQKTRIIQCAGVAFNMVNRVGDTAKRAVAALESVEDKYRDTRYINSNATAMNSPTEQRYKMINAQNAMTLNGTMTNPMGGTSMQAFTPVPSTM